MNQNYRNERPSRERATGHHSRPYIRLAYKEGDFVKFPEGSNRGVGTFRVAKAIFDKYYGTGKYLLEDMAHSWGTIAYFEHELEPATKPADWDSVFHSYEQEQTTLKEAANV